MPPQRPQPVLNGSGRHPRDEIEESEPTTPTSPYDYPDEPDDFTRIEGIGNGFAEVIHGMGITSFADLFDIDDEAIGLLYQQVEGVSDRFGRHGWTGAARAPHAQKASALS